MHNSLKERVFNLVADRPISSDDTAIPELFQRYLQK